MVIEAAQMKVVYKERANFTLPDPIACPTNAQADWSKPVPIIYSIDIMSLKMD